MRAINGTATIEINDYNGMIKDLERLDALEVALDKCLTQLVEQHFTWDINNAIHSGTSYDAMLKKDEWGYETTVSRDITAFAKMYELTRKDVLKYVKALYETCKKEYESSNKA